MKCHLTQRFYQSRQFDCEIQYFSFCLRFCLNLISIWYNQQATGQYDYGFAMIKVCRKFNKNLDGQIQWCGKFVQGWKIGSVQPDYAANQILALIIDFQLKSGMKLLLSTVSNIRRLSSCYKLLKRLNRKSKFSTLEWCGQQLSTLIIYNPIIFHAKD